jgi:hypothetical protein
VSLVLVAALAAVSAPGLAAATTSKKPTHKKKGPTAAQKLQAAVKAAERSPDLWATVNQCTSATTGDIVGIRGQIPSLGVPATLSMSFSVFYWNGSAFQSVAPPSGGPPVVSVKGTHGIHQGGVNFPFSPPTAGSTYVVRGTITFTWTVAGKVVGTVTRNTGHGYTNVGYSTPPGYNAGTCTLT